MNIECLETEKTESAERHIVHIINPVSGSGRKFLKIRQNATSLGEDIYLTTRDGDCADFTAELLTKDPFAHIVAHGGDGTMGEAAQGIMDAGAGKTSLFTGIPSGSGNDFLRYMFSEKKTFGKAYPTDLIIANGKYSANVVNMGFDCSVVEEAQKIRKIPGFGGSFSYIAGIVATAFKKQLFRTTLRMSGVYGKDDDHEEVLSGDFLLVALANGRYYGGGFNIAPLADSADGYIDVVAVENVPVSEFAILAPKLRSGAQVDRETGELRGKFKKIMHVTRCKQVSLDGFSSICYDGEIVKASSIDAKIVPGAVMYTPPRKAWLV